MGIKLAPKVGVENSAMLSSLHEAHRKNNEAQNRRDELITVYYINGAVYLSSASEPMDVTEYKRAIGKVKKRAMDIDSKAEEITISSKPDDPNTKLDEAKNYKFQIRRSALQTMASDVITGGHGDKTKDILVYDQAYKNQLDARAENLLRKAAAVGLLGGLWAIISHPIKLLPEIGGELNIISSIFLGLAVGVANYKLQVADYKEKNGGKEPPPEVLKQIFHESRNLAIQVTAAKIGWVLAHQVVAQAFSGLLHVTVGTMSVSNPYFWVAVASVMVVVAALVVTATALLECKRNADEGKSWRLNTADEGKTNYLGLALFAMGASLVIMLSLALPGFTGMKEALFDSDMGKDAAKVLMRASVPSAIVSSILGKAMYDKYQNQHKVVPIEDGDKTEGQNSSPGDSGSSTPERPSNFTNK